MKRPYLLLPLLLFSAPLFAQKPKPIEVVVDQVQDRRSPGPFGGLTLSLALPKLKTTEVAASRVFVNSAVDDLGSILVDTERSEPRLEQNYRASMDFKGWSSVPTATVSVPLRNPDRKAKMLKSVSGEIELFLPGRDPNSVAEVASFMTTRGKALSHKALKANAVEITLLSEAQIEAEKKRAAEKKRKELTEYGYEGETLESALTDFLGSLFGVDESNVPVRIKDPQKRIQEVAFITPEGEVKQASIDENEGLTTLSTWGGTPQPNWKLRVSMRTPKNLVRHTFALSEIALP